MNFVIIQMRICRKPRTHVLPTRRVYVYYTCMYKFMYLYTDILIYFVMCVGVCVCLRLRECVCVYVCVCVSISLCLSLSLSLSLSVCVYVCTYVHVSFHWVHSLPSGNSHGWQYQGCLMGSQKSQLRTNRDRTRQKISSHLRKLYGASAVVWRSLLRHNRLFFVMNR